MRDRTAALLLGVAFDAGLGEVGGRLHPVALIGRALEAAYRPWRRRRPAVQALGGTAALVAVAGICAGAAAALERAPQGRLLRPLALALLFKPTFAIRTLLAEAGGVADALEAGATAEARHRLRALVSRPVADLSSEQVASAAIESVAENLADSVVAPMLFFVVLGLPGAVAYRVVNTADAMVGYRGATEWLGKSAARLDDFLNLLPSRLAAGALILAAAITGGRPAARRGWTVLRRDGGLTASPNAGRPMAAMAGVIGRRLEKPEHYLLGPELAAPAAVDVRTSVRTAAVAAGLVVLAAATLLEARR